jgi:hypothetical protein
MQGGSSSLMLRIGLRAIAGGGARKMSGFEPGIFRTPFGFSSFIEHHGPRDVQQVTYDTGGGI